MRPPPFEITKVILSKKTASHSFDFVPAIDPGHSGTFTFSKDAPCMWWVTLLTEYRPAITAPTQFNTCTQTTIGIDGGDSAGTPSFKFY
ncbi:MAG TPA: hypothetical protein VN890_08650 [Methylocella sp.]|nr:hypothetical protein [Methylocella sp.]